MFGLHFLDAVNLVRLNAFPVFPRQLFLLSLMSH